MQTKLRPQESDRTLDELEVNWWNENADTIEAAWALPAPLRSISRSHYLNRAKKFFLGSGRRRPVTILEIGSGSGWVGRLMAEPGKLHILGIDNSESQVRLAKEASQREKLEQACDYVCTDLPNWMRDHASDVQATGILIHAILHHFSWQEIHSIMEKIAEFPLGTRLFIYEPVYLAPVRETPFKRKLFNFLNALPGKWAEAALRTFEKDKDIVLAKKLDTLFVDAAKNGWVLSPKETVFQEQEFENLLRQYFVLHDRFLCNFHSLFVSQQAAMYSNQTAYAPFLTWITQAARLIDEVLYVSKLLRLTDAYVFMGYECEIT